MGIDTNQDICKNISYCDYTKTLIDELSRIGIIERLKRIPQLGVVKVPKKHSKTRYEYVALQLYLHDIIKENLKNELKYSYNNTLKLKEFCEDFDGKKKISMFEIIQLLIIIYNIGHFYNTFTASRAITLLSSEDKKFYEKVVSSFESEEYRLDAKKILDSKNYHRLHLLNSLLVLERCSTSEDAIKISMGILHKYINEDIIPENDKMKYVFSIFRHVRRIAYMIYDLQIANTPFNVNLDDTEGLKLIFKELLSEYNNNDSLVSLIDSLAKLLDDTVYKENSNAICYYNISRKIVSNLKKSLKGRTFNYYDDLFLNKSSELNTKYMRRKDYVKQHILKLTFSNENRGVSELLLSELEKINNSRVGYYDRTSGDQTILVSIKEECSSSNKRYTAYKILKCVVKHLRNVLEIDPSDIRFLLSVKFFLYYLFDQNPLAIKPTISNETCVICTRGSNSRKKAISSLLAKSRANDDLNHEVDFLLSRLKKDERNDICISVPASIQIYNKDNIGKHLCEFDGMIIYPNRGDKQVVFLEAKNTGKNPSKAMNCLVEKFENFTFDYKKKDIQTLDYDAFFEYSIISPHKAFNDK